MWVLIMTSAFATLAAVLSSCAAYTALSSRSKPAARTAALKLFRYTWGAASIGTVGGIIQLHRAGLL